MIWTVMTKKAIEVMGLPYGFLLLTYILIHCYVINDASFVNGEKGKDF